jgi:sugar phosphate permease
MAGTDTGKSEIAERTAAAARRGLFYGWYIVAAGAGTNFVVIGLVTFSFGVFVRPIQDELGWSIAAISLGVSLRSFEQGLLSPITGVMVDRLGPRRMAMAGIVVLTIGLLMFSQARTLEVYYASSILMAFGQSLGSLTPFSAALMFWFVRKRGRAMGLLNTGNGAGYLMTPLVALSVTQLGWRETLVIAAVVVFVFGIPLAAVLRDRPEPYGYGPDGDAPRARATDTSYEPPGMSVAEGLSTPAFYLLAVSTALSGGMIISWILHQIPHMESVGFSLGGAALIAGIYGAFQLGLRPLVGWAGDRFGRRRLYAIAFFAQGVGLVIFANLTSDRLWLLPFYYATFAFGNSTWIVLQMSLVADYFGPRRFATLRGLGSTLNMPLGVGVMIYAVFAAFGGILILLIRRPFYAELQRA